MIDYRWLYVIPCLTAPWIILFPILTAGTFFHFILWVICIVGAMSSIVIRRFGEHLNEIEAGKQKYTWIGDKQYKVGKPDYNLIWQLQQELYPELVSAGLIEKPKPKPIPDRPARENRNAYWSANLVREYFPDGIWERETSRPVAPPPPPPPGLALDNYKRPQPQMHPSHICCKCGAYVSDIYVDMSKYKTYCYKCSPSSELVKFDEYNNRVEIFEETQGAYESMSLELLKKQFGLAS